jgi:hypothetical protein
MSVSDSAGVAGLRRLKAALGAEQPDIYSYHLYLGGHGEQAAAVLRSAAAVARPAALFVGETGYPTAGPPRVAGVPDAPDFAAAQQRLFYEQVSASAAADGLPPPAPWMLSDLAASAVPPAAVNSQTTAERSFGLLRLDGSDKPAAATVRMAFSGRTPPAWFNQDLSQCATSPGGSPEPLAWREVDAGDGRLRCTDRGVALSATAGTTAQVPAFATDPPIVITPGQWLTASTLALSRDATGENQLALAFFAADGRYLGQVSSPALTDSSRTWTRLTAGGRVPPGAAWFELALKSAHNRGTVMYRNLAVSAG